jgi:hypothetical protein
MVDRRIGVIINGATGRMGTAQHMPNLLAIAAEGGLKLRSGDRLVPDLLLVGRNADRLSALAAAHGGLRWTTNLAEALAGSDVLAGHRGVHASAVCRCRPIGGTIDQGWRR